MQLPVQSRAQTPTSPFLLLSVLAVLCVAVACKRSRPTSGFVAARVNREILGPSRFPTAADPSRVGTYASDTKSGAGYFYDDVLEYRVWSHPENNAEPVKGDKDYFAAFSQYELAETFHAKTRGSEPPLALVHQREWVDEPTRGHFVHRKDGRTTEWRVEWLNASKRSKNSIDDFLKNPYEADTAK